MGSGKVGDPAPDEPFDLASLDGEDPFEIDDDNRPHLFKHGPFGVEDLYDVWWSDPRFWRAHPPADWIMIGQVPGDVLVIPLAKPRSGDPRKARPIGVYRATQSEAARYRQER